METCKLCVLVLSLIALVGAAPADSPTDAPAAAVTSAEATTQPPTEAPAVVELVSSSGDSTSSATTSNVEETTVKDDKPAEQSSNDTAKPIDTVEKVTEAIQEKASEAKEMIKKSVEKVAN